MRVGANEFDEPRLAAIYDAGDGPRDDLDHSEGIVAELGARSVLDVGCGTGDLAIRLAAAGLDVVGVDPAVAMLGVARAKPGAARVDWRHGDATVAPSQGFDVATMTGNVAQVFLTDEAWASTLRAIARSLRSGGHLVFETRDPSRRAWERWNPEHTRTTIDTASGRVEVWCEVTDVDEPFVSFRWTHVFDADGATVTSDSTLRFRSRAEVESTLAAAGFDVVEVRDAPDRPGLEWVFIARRRDEPGAS